MVSQLELECDNFICRHTIFIHSGLVFGRFVTLSDRSYDALTHEILLDRQACGERDWCVNIGSRVNRK